MATEPIRTARKALNSLQYEPNGRTIVGNNHSSNQLTNTKQALLETNEKLSKLKKRNSISLPDINLISSFNDENQLNKSATSTPNRKGMRKLAASKSNISIIMEEKENPNFMKAKFEKMKSIEAKIAKKLAATKTLTKQVASVETKEMSIQCSKAEEDMLFGESVEGTGYWRLIAIKRFNAIGETKKENAELHAGIEMLNEKNERLRENIKELYELINQYKEIQKAALEAEDVENDVEDSGYDVAV